MQLFYKATDAILDLQMCTTGEVEGQATCRGDSGGCSLSRYPYYPAVCTRACPPRPPACCACAGQCEVCCLVHAVHP